MVKKFISILICLLLISNVQSLAYSDNNNFQYTISQYGDCGAAIKRDNSLWTWESSVENDGELKFNKLLNDVKSIYGNFAVQSDGTIWKYKEEYAGLEESLKDISKISSGVSHVLFIKSDNSLWGMGLNDMGQLGLNTTEEEYKAPIKIMNNVKDVAVGYSHSVVLKTDGSVWTFGSNDYGALGCGDDVSESDKPIKIMENVKKVFAGESSGFAIDENDTLYRWGSNYGNGVGLKEDEIQRTPTKYAENAKSVNSHWGFNLILKQDDTLWIYGDSENSKTGYTCYPTGIHFANLPLKLIDDVNSISEYNVSSIHKNLILKNSGELFEFDLIDGETGHNPKYKIVPITKDIKLPCDEVYENEKTFGDIEYISEDTKKAITSLLKAGIIDGTSETTFSPDKPITRAEIAALLLRMTSHLEESGNGGFSDVPEDKWYYNTAGASKKYNIVDGFEDNTFRGDETVSKVQLVSLAARVLRNEKNIDGRENLNFQIDIPDWAKEDVALAMQEELISVEKDLINLNEPMTRGEAAVILYRLYNKI